MARYSDVLQAKEMRQKVILNIGRALYNLDPTRQVFKSYNDLPSVGTSYSLIEYLPTRKNGIETYGSEIYESGVDEFTEDTVISQTAAFLITAANDDPYDFLNDLVISRNTEDFWFEFFSKQNIGVNSVGDISPASIPTDAGDWEERWSTVLTVNYLSKKSKILNTLAAISYGWTVAGDPSKDDVTGTGEASLTP